MACERFKAEEHRIREAYAIRESGGHYSWFEPGHLHRVQERERQMLRLLKQFKCVLSDRRILEVGCGDGYWIREFIKWGARPENITGVDLLPDRIAQAKQLCPSDVRLLCGSATNLALPDASYDLVLQSTVFTSILDGVMKQQIASEMLRLVKPGGLILWYDYHVNNPWNPDVRGVKRREIYKLFGNCRITLRRITMAPPLAHRIAPCSWLLCSLLGRIPFLCTHYLGVIQKG